MRRAVIISMGRYPNGDAAAVRHHALARLLTESGYEVTLLGYGEYNGGRLDTYDGIRFASLRARGKSVISKVYSRLTHGGRVVKFIKKHIGTPDLMLVDYVRPHAFSLIEKYARRTGCAIYHDSCEWYSPEEFSNGARNRGYKYVNKVNTRIIRSPWRAVSISTYLDAHFKSVGVESVRIPVIMDVENMPFNADKRQGERTVFVYAGSPGKKDLLSRIFEGFAALCDEDKARLELHIIGVSREALVSVCGVAEEHIAALEGNLFIHGRLPREEAVEWVRRADFTVLLREAEARYAKAGFPTKVVESLASATPVVTNLTSDLALYLRDGENSIIAGGAAPSALTEALSRAVRLTRDEVRALSEGARGCALAAFDYRAYTGLFKYEENDNSKEQK